MIRPGPTRAAVRLARDELSYLAWEPRGVPNGRTALLLHGLQSNAVTMTTIAEALAARGWRAIAPDLPGHGHTYALDGSDRERPGPFDTSRLALVRLRADRRFRIASTARVVADLGRRIGLERPAVVGHSWGASVASLVPLEGLACERLVLFDPPYLTEEEARAMGAEVVAETTRSRQEARSTLESEHSDWGEADLEGKSEALTQVSNRVMIGIVAANVPFDPTPALLALRKKGPGLPVSAIVGEPAFGSMVPDEARGRLIDLLGEANVQLLRGAGHSFHRTHFEAFLAMLVRALADTDRAPG